MDIFIGIIVGLLVLMALVTAHEFGHFILARRNGVRVLEFGICFPPRAIAWIRDPKTKKWQKIPKKDWNKPQESLVFSLNWLPIGGFCQMDGESDADERKGTFGAATYWQKTKILFGGVAVNWLVAIIIFTILAWTGMPNFLNNQFTIAADTHTDYKYVEIVTVAENSPAADAGIQAGDKLVSVDNNAYYHGNEFTDYNNQHPDQDVTFKIQRGEEFFDATAHLNPAGSEYLLGVTLSSTQSLSYSTWSAPIVGVGLTAQLTGETFKGLGQLVYNLFSGTFSLLSFNETTRQEGQAALQTVGDSVSGPVGIIGTLFPAFTAAGPSNLAFLAALISVSLACMNVLPIPALDGGRWLLITIYRLRRKKLSKETEEKIVSRAFTVLLILIAVVTALDIARFFR